MSSPQPVLDPDASPAHGAPGNRLTAIGSAIRRLLGDRRRAAGAVAIVILLALGYLIVGLEIIPVALLAALASFAWRREPGRPLALTASVLLALAAIGTVFVVEPSPANWTMSFPADRTVAADAGRLAGLLFALASVLMAYTERTRTPALRRPLVVGVVRRPERAGAGVSVPVLAIGAAAVGVILTVAVALRLVLAPPALSAAYDGLLANLRHGTSYAVGLATAAGFPVSTPPLAPLTVAYVPVAARELTVIFGLITLVACGRLGMRLRGLWAGGLALTIGAVLPAMWDVPLPVILAGLALIGAVMMADGAEITRTRAVWAGVLLGLAVLARPETAVVVGLVVVWSWDRGTRRRHLVAMGAVAVATAAPWWVWLHGQFGGFLPAEGLGAFMNDPLSANRHAPLLTACLAGATLGVAMALARRRQLWRDWWILWAVPLMAMLLDVLEVQYRDPLSWSAPLAVALLAAGLAQSLGRARSEPARRRGGAVTGPLPFGYRDWTRPRVD